MDAAAKQRMPRDAIQTLGDTVRGLINSKRGKEREIGSVVVVLHDMYGACTSLIEGGTNGKDLGIRQMH